MIRFFNIIFWILLSIRKKVIKSDHCRFYSNQILRQYCQAFTGDIINVSGWQDSDKQGNFYRNYYKSYSKYTISNIYGVNGMPENISSEIDSIFLDLNNPIPKTLKSRYDVVFTHTVLEHIYDTQQALENLAALSKDVVITVMPFSQSVHYTNSYSDFVRLTPYYLKKFFEEKGFTVLLSTANENPYYTVYIIFIVSKFPERYKDFFIKAPLRYDIQLTPLRWGKYDGSGLNLTGE